MTRLPPSTATVTLRGERYRIERELGQGGMATVFLARDLRHGRDVAVKIIRPEVAAALGKDRFVREIGIAAQLQHPHIVGLIDSGETDEPAPRPYYVMPLVDGDSVRQRLDREGPLPIAEALRLVREVGEALHHAHQRGVVHRDIKPDNILLLSGHALVADFGIARALRAAGGNRLTLAGVALGTPAYMSPEQAAGEEVDARSDQYSLACVLYEMLAGAPPFTALTGAQVMARHLLDPVPPLTTVRQGVPPGIARAVARALAKNPADRFHDLNHFLAALDGPEEAVASPPSVVVVPFTNASPDPDTDYFADGLTEEVIADLSNIRSVRVIARNSSLRLKGTDKDTRSLGRELDVRYVLAGSVRRSGSQLRITAHLADTTDDRQVWAGKFGGTVEEVFALQERLAREIVGALRLTLTPEEDRRLATRNLADFAVFDGHRDATLERLDDYLRHLQTYQRVRQEIYKFTRESVEQAVRLAQEGLATLGESELLLSALCHALIGREWIGEGQDLDEAAHCVARIFARWPDSAYGHLLDGAIHYRRGNPRAAVDALERARMVRPHDPDVLIYLSVSYWLAGRSKAAQDAISHALEVDPLNPVNWNMSGLVRWLAGDLDGSISDFRRGVALGTDTPMCHASLGLALLMAGRDDEAAPVFEDLARRFPDDPYEQLWRLIWFAQRGDVRAVRAGFTPEVISLAKVDEGCAYMAAAARALIGDRDEALDWFAHMMRDRGFIAWPYFAERDPFLTGLRDDPRYRALLDEMKQRYEAFDRG
ncbi:MAG TPA: protein kinase [Gemmatimonadales bacterium]|nr:protein kinase [Gemmatimonadales bacterium]